MRNTGLEEAQAGIKISGRNINNLRYADDTTLMAESEEELMSLLMKMKEESEKVGLKLNIQKMKIMASGPITSWDIDGETVERVTDFIWGASKITADGDCSHEIKRCLLLGRKVMTHLKHIKKQGHYFANKGPSSQDYGFSSGKESACNMGDPGSISRLGKSTGEGNSSPLQCSCMENPRNGGAWWAAIYGVTTESEMTEGT